MAWCELEWDAAAAGRDVAVEYAAMRGLPSQPPDDSSANDPGEVAADDFRIAVCRVEPGTWPHLGVPHPDQVPAVADWWGRQ